VGKTKKKVVCGKKRKKDSKKNVEKKFSLSQAKKMGNGVRNTMGNGACEGGKTRETLVTLETAIQVI